LIEDKRAPFFHEAGVFHAPSNTLFITSNHIPDRDPGAVSTANKTIIITKIEIFGLKDFTRDKVRCPERNYMANGGVNYRDGVLFCAQGSLNEPGGLIYMEAKRPHKTTTLLNNYHGRQFIRPTTLSSTRTAASGSRSHLRLRARLPAPTAAAAASLSFRPRQR
jgi:gluconolactonase